MKQTILLLACLPLAVSAQTILRQDFENDLGGWRTAGSDTARVHLTTREGSFKNGKSALAFDYESSGAHPAIALLPLSGSVASMQMIGFWAASEAPVALAVTLAEKGGGRYSAVAWLNALNWERLEFVPTDFALDQSPDAPKDPDNKLDLDQVDTVALVDLSQILTEKFRDSKVPLAVAAQAGPHRIFIDDFEISASAPKWYQPKQPLVIDRFLHPTPLWFTLGGADLGIEKDEKLLKANSLVMSYQAMEDRFVVMMHDVTNVDLSGAKQITFDIASDNRVNLAMALETRAPGAEQGPRFMQHFRVAAGTPDHKHFSFDSFEHDPNSPGGEDARLDPARIARILIVDVTGVPNGSANVNTLRIANLTASKALPAGE